MRSFSFLFEKTNKLALTICRAAHDDTADYISLDHEQNGFSNDINVMIFLLFSWSCFTKEGSCSFDLLAFFNH